MYVWVKASCFLKLIFGREGRREGGRKGGRVGGWEGGREEGRESEEQRQREEQFFIGCTMTIIILLRK